MKICLTNIIGLTIIYILLGCSQPNSKNNSLNLDLSGTWQLKLDAENEGIENKWFNQTFTETLELPGCLQAQAYGEKPGPDTKWWQKLDLSKRHPSLEKYAKADSNFKLIQYLMPRNHYIGAAWYTREIEIPKKYEGKNILLTLERCHWESQVWVDGNFIGKNQSLATAHVYDLSQITPGKHKLSIRIDNGQIYEIGGMAHSVSDQTQGTWNGIVGEISLKATPKAYLQSVKTVPDIHSKTVRVNIEIANPNKISGKFALVADAEGYNNGNTHKPETLSKSINLEGAELHRFSFNYKMGENVQLWDEFDPNLYNLELTLSDSEKTIVHQKKVSFGMREFVAQGAHFYVNGIRTYLRGNVDCAVNPRTAFAPITVERWKEIFRVYKDFGLNHVRFHSWCPPKQAFIAADEMGLYLAPEVHEWSWVAKGEMFNFFKKESEEILNYFANHPSFVMMGLGNESGIADDAAQELIDLWKSIDRSRLYMVKASHAPHQGIPAEIDFEVLGHIKGKYGDKDRIRTRYQAFWPPLPENSDLFIKKPQTNIDWSNAINDYFEKHKERPLLAHETAQFCAYPDVFNEIKKYTGYLRPTYLEIAADQLEERGMTDQLADFVKNSGEWQVLLTREETEAAMRTSNYAGFQWLGLSDFTGQNTAPVGFVDAFYEPKSYVTPGDMRRFCAATVLLARLPKRVYTSKEKFNFTAELFHFAKEDIQLKDFTITLRNSNEEVLKTQIYDGGTFSQGNTQALGSFNIELSTLPTPAKYNVELSSNEHGLANDYDFWVYADEKPVEFESNVLLTNNWNEKSYKALENGKTVLLLPKIGTLKGNLPGCFTTLYWTSFGELGGQSSTNGIMMDNKHPLFKNFPSETHANWQWWELLTQCQPMILDQFEEKTPWPKEYRPLVQPIDTWKLNRKLGLVVEAKVGKGKLLICSMDIESDLENRPVAKQFRKSLMKYMQSSEFNPQTEIKVSAVSSLFDQSKPEIIESLQGLPTEG